MSSIMLTVIVCAPVLVAWLAVCGPWYRSRHRARRRLLRDQAEWARLAAGHPGLDADLDRTLTAEDERTRRHP
jgi:hypothetical protein